MDRAKEYKDSAKGPQSQKGERSRKQDREPVSQANDANNFNDEEEGNIDDFIELLVQHQKECEVNGKYVEAEMAKNRISELKSNKKKKQMDELEV